MSLANEKTLSTRVQVITRAKGGNAVRSAAYRSGENLECEKTAERWDYSRREGVEDAFIVAPPAAPAWAFDRAELWNRVETMERRKDAQLARELRVSLPLETTSEQRRAIAAETVQSEFVDRGMVADVAIHLYGQSWKEGHADTAEKLAEWQGRGYRFLDEKASAAACAAAQDRPHVLVTHDRAGNVKDYRLFQPHFHVMLTLRPLAGDGLGFGSKIAVRDDWNRIGKEDWQDARARMAEIQNRVLHQSGVGTRFDHRSYEERRQDAEERGRAARAAGAPAEAARQEARARSFAQRAQPFMGIAFKVKQATERMGERLAQWVAVKHRNRLVAQLHAQQDRDPVELVSRLHRLASIAGKGLGLDLEAEREEDLSYER